MVSLGHNELNQVGLHNRDFICMWAELEVVNFGKRFTTLQVAPHAERVTDPLWGESTGGFPSQRASTTDSMRSDLQYCKPFTNVHTQQLISRDHLFSADPSK